MENDTWYARVKHIKMFRAERAHQIEHNKKFKQKIATQRIKLGKTPTDRQKT